MKKETVAPILFVVGLAAVPFACIEFGHQYDDPAPAQPPPPPAIVSKPAPPPAPSKPAEIVNLPALFTKSKSEVRRRLSHFTRTARDKTPADYPDPMAAGGETWTYDIGGGMELSTQFNRQGYCSLVSASELQPLGYTLDRAKDLLTRFGIPDPGEPSGLAANDNRWDGRGELTGGSEIHATTVDEGGPIWQVQMKTPEAH